MSVELAIAAAAFMCGYGFGLSRHPSSPMTRAEQRARFGYADGYGSPAVTPSTNVPTTDAPVSGIPPPPTPKPAAGGETWRGM